MNTYCFICFTFLMTAYSFGQTSAERSCIYPKNRVEPLQELYLQTDAQINFVKRVDATFSIGKKQGTCAIEFHGNSTRAAAKKSFDLEFRTVGGMETSDRILGLPHSTGIILLANVFDPSMLRNALAFDLWEQLGNTSPHYSFCHLYVDSSYQGVYMAAEKIRTVDRLIDKTHWKPQPNLLENPFFMKIDWENEGTVRIDGLYDWPFQAKVVDPKPFTNKWIGYNKELEAYFKLVNHSLNSIISNDKKSLHYSERIDVNSFADYFLINELTKNPDAYHSSVFFFSSLDAKLTMGPIWDFDLAFANRLNSEDDDVVGWIYKKEWTSKELRTMPTWWHLLMCDPAFRAACLNRLDLIDQWLHSDEFQKALSDHMEQLRQAMEMDDERWGKETDQFVAGPVTLSMEEEVLTMSAFLESRLIWMKEALPNESCLSPFEVSARQDKYEIVEMDSDKIQFTINFKNDLTAGTMSKGNRFEYYSSYSYELYDSNGNLLRKGPVNGKELVIDASVLSVGDYYLIVSEHSSDDLIASSAPRMPTVYRKKLVVR